MKNALIISNFRMKEQSKGQKLIDRENGESLKFYTIICTVGIAVSFTPPVLARFSSEDEFAYGPFFMPVFG